MMKLQSFVLLRRALTSGDVCCAHNLLQPQGLNPKTLALDFNPLNLDTPLTSQPTSVAQSLPAAELEHAPGAQLDGAGEAYNQASSGFAGLLSESAC